MDNSLEHEASSRLDKDKTENDGVHNLKDVVEEAKAVLHNFTNCEAENMQELGNIVKKDKTVLQPSFFSTQNSKLEDVGPLAKNQPKIPQVEESSITHELKDEQVNNLQTSESQIGNSGKLDAEVSKIPELVHASQEAESTARVDRDPSREGPFVIELFAGSGRVTAHLKFYGIKDSFGVDHKKLSNIAPVMVCDLTTTEGQRLCKRWAGSKSCAGVFAAPPCGTCSRAREIQLRDAKGRRLPCPPPLRSDSSPNGLPNLSHQNRMRVSSANKLYHFLAELVVDLVKRKIPVVIENPRSSLYWLTSYFQKVRHLFMFTAHQACAYGSDRPKWTALAHTHKAFQRINLCCPGEGPSHKHKPWGFSETSKNTFATAEETAYPMKLADHIALAFKETLEETGWKLAKPSWSHTSFAAMRAIAGSQPKASKVPSLVSEHQTTVKIKGPEAILATFGPSTMKRIESAMQVPESCESTVAILPAYSQLLRTSTFRDKGGSELNKNCASNMVSVQVWGIPWSEHSFVDQAIASGHPKSFSALLPPVLKHAIDEVAGKPAERIISLRAAWFNKWLSRASDLQSSEKRLKLSMPKHLQRILDSKRILLLEEILRHEGYPDMGVVDELKNGTELVDEVESTGVFEKVFRPSEMTVQQLKDGAKASNKAILHGTRSSGDPEVDEVVYNKTLEEREAGWLTGPYRLSELPSEATISRRFGLRQPNKIRLIDDLSGSNVNKTVQTNESPKPHTLDVVASMSLYLLEKLSSQVLGATFDLKSAYRQLGISESSLLFSFIACYNPTSKEPEIFRMNAVPFGATRAVYSFLRMARCLWWLGCRCLMIPWSSFFDDYITFAPIELAANTSETVCLLFDLLGWQYAKEGEKAAVFGTSFNALGVHISLEKFLEGKVFFANTERRIDELRNSLTSVLQSGFLTHKESLKLKGRLQFADGQLFGRLGKLCLKEVSNHAFCGASDKISSRCAQLLNVFREQLQVGPPREISKSTSNTWFLFTDACYEPSEASWPCGLGGVLVDNVGRSRAYFSHCLNKSHMVDLGADKKKTIIFEAELLAVILAMRVWSSFLNGTQAVFYIDNNSARDVAISTNGRSSMAMKLVESLLVLEQQLSIYPWYTRVPSPSNCADAPSRNDTSFLELSGVDRSEVVDLVGDLISGLKKVS